MCSFQMIPRTESAFLWHERQVFTAAWRPDGQQLASGGDEPTVYVWDMARELPPEPAWIRPLLKLRLPTEKTLHVHGIAWSPDLAKILVWDGLNGVHVWDARTGAHLASAGPKLGVFTASWSRDGTRVLAASQNAVRIHDGATLKAVRTIRTPGAYTIAAHWNGDESRLLAAGYNAPVTLYPERTELAASKGVWRARWSADGRRVLFGRSGTERPCRWDAATGEKLRVYPEAATSAEWSPDESRVVAFSGTTLPRIVVYDADTGAVTSSGALRGIVFGIEWSPSGSRFIAYGDGLEVRAPGSDAPLLEFESFSILRTARWSPDERRIVTGGDERCLRVWNVTR